MGFAGRPTPGGNIVQILLQTLARESRQQVGVMDPVNPTAEASLRQINWFDERYFEVFSFQLFDQKTKGYFNIFGLFVQDEIRKYPYVSILYVVFQG